MTLNPAEMLEDAAAQGAEVKTTPSERVQKLALEMEELKEEIDAQEELLKDKKERYEIIRKRELPEAMEEAGMLDAERKGSFTTATGCRINTRNDFYANVKAEDKPALFEHLRQHGHGDLIREDVNVQTLKAFCRELQENGEALPPQVKGHYETSVIITKKKKGTK